MTHVISGFSVVSEGPWTPAQLTAIRGAIRELLARTTASPITEEEIDAHWREHLDPPGTVIFDRRVPHSAFWITDDWDDATAWREILRKHCEPVGVDVLEHLST